MTINTEGHFQGLCQHYLIGGGNIAMALSALGFGRGVFEMAENREVRKAVNALGRDLPISHFGVTDAALRRGWEAGGIGFFGRRMTS